MIRWLLLSDAGWWIGGALIYGAVIALAGLLVRRYGGVTMGPDPQVPEVSPSGASTVTIPVVPAEPVAPNYMPVKDFYPLAGYLTAAIDAAADATEELTEVIEAHPLDVTVEIEAVDPSVPLFYAIRKPRPYVAESFTEGITRAQRERALASGAEQ